MSAPRIDTFRNDIADAIKLLRFLSDQVEDVHVLATNRHKAAASDRVRGGSRDYALDSHGDSDARELYTDAAKLVNRMVDDIRDQDTALRAYLTTAGKADKTRTAARTSADEVLAAIDARRRRKARGEYEPVPLAKQPTVIPAQDWRTEVEVLRSAVRKVTREFAADHQTCQPPEEGIGRFKRKLLRRYPTKMLSTREREAWRNTQSVAAADEEKAS